MPRPRSLAAPLFAFAPALTLAACAEPPPPAAAPPQPPPAAFTAGQPSAADREMVAIGQAEDEIDRLFPGSNAPPGPRKGGPPPPKAEEREVARDAPYKQEPRGGAGPGLSGDPCAVACKALASMASSADRLCHLAGETDGRCDDARARVRGASARVKSSCPGCAVSTAPAATPKGTPGPEAPNGPAPGMPGSSTGLPIP